MIQNTKFINILDLPATMAISNCDRISCQKFLCCNKGLVSQYSLCRRFGSETINQLWSFIGFPNSKLIKLNIKNMNKQILLIGGIISLLVLIVSMTESEPKMFLGYSVDAWFLRIFWLINTFTFFNAYRTTKQTDTK